jgi:hypothetical protein
MADIVLFQHEFYIMIGIMVFTILMTILLGFILKWTPAWTFFKARLKKVPIARVLSRFGSSKFTLAKNPWRGTADLDDKSCKGSIELTPNTGITDVKSGVKVFDLFSEFASTIPPEYSIIVQELREKGLKIESWTDYEFYVKLSHPVHGQKLIDAAKTEDKKTKLRAFQKKLQELDIEIKPFKTYKLSNLAHMFPFNVRPEYIQAKVIYAVTEKIKSMGLNKDRMIAIGVFIILAAIGVMIIVKFVKEPNCPACQCLLEGAAGTIQTIGNATKGNISF